MRNATWEQFSTESVRPSQRVNYWNDFGSETLCTLTVDPCDREQFNAKLSRVEFGPLGLIKMQSTGATAQGSIGEAGGWAAREKDSLLLILPEVGFSRFEQNHQSLDLSPGDLLIRDLSRPWLHACREEMDMLMIKIPYSALLTRVDDPGRLIGINLKANRPAVSMAVDVIRIVNRTLLAEPEGDWHGAMADLVLDSVATVYHSTSTSFVRHFESEQRAAIRRDAKNYIIRNLDDAELSVAKLAVELGVGQRRLQRAFVEVGETPSQFILDQRLELAARELSLGKRECYNSILEVALSSGFSDASHFSRSFSRRYGVSPRNYRGTPPLPS